MLRGGGLREDCPVKNVAPLQLVEIPPQILMTSGFKAKWDKPIKYGNQESQQELQKPIRMKLDSECTVQQIPIQTVSIETQQRIPQNFRGNWDKPVIYGKDQSESSEPKPFRPLAPRKQHVKEIPLQIVQYDKIQTIQQQVRLRQAHPVQYGRQSSTPAVERPQQLQGKGLGEPCAAKEAVPLQLVEIPPITVMSQNIRAKQPKPFIYGNEQIQQTIERPIIIELDPINEVKQQSRPMEVISIDQVKNMTHNYRSKQPHPFVYGQSQSQNGEAKPVKVGTGRKVEQKMCQVKEIKLNFPNLLNENRVQQPPINYGKTIRESLKERVLKMQLESKEVNLKPLEVTHIPIQKTMLKSLKGKEKRPMFYGIQISEKETQREAKLITHSVSIIEDKKQLQVITYEPMLVMQSQVKLEQDGPVIRGSQVSQTSVQRSKQQKIKKQVEEEVAPMPKLEVISMESLNVIQLNTNLKSGKPLLYGSQATEGSSAKPKPLNSDPAVCSEVKEVISYDCQTLINQTIKSFQAKPTQYGLMKKEKPVERPEPAVKYEAFEAVDDVKPKEKHVFEVRSFESIPNISHKFVSLQDMPTLYGSSKTELSRDRPSMLKNKDQTKCEVVVQEIVQYDCLSVINQTIRGQQEAPYLYGTSKHENAISRPVKSEESSVKPQEVISYECLAVLSQQTCGYQIPPVLYGKEQTETGIERPIIEEVDSKPKEKHVQQIESIECLAVMSQCTRGQSEFPFRYAKQEIEITRERPKQLRGRECKLIEAPPIQCVSQPSLTSLIRRVDLRQDCPYIYGSEQSMPKVEQPAQIKNLNNKCEIQEEEPQQQQKLELITIENQQEMLLKTVGQEQPPYIYGTGEQQTRKNRPPQVRARTCQIQDEAIIEEAVAPPQIETLPLLTIQQHGLSLPTIVHVPNMYGNASFEQYRYPIEIEEYDSKRALFQAELITAEEVEIKKQAVLPKIVEESTKPVEEPKAVDISPEPVAEEGVIHVKELPTDHMDELMKQFILKKQAAVNERIMADKEFEANKKKYMKSKGIKSKQLDEKQMEDYKNQYIHKKGLQKEQQNIAEYEKMKAAYMKKKGVKTEQALTQDNIEDLKKNYMAKKSKKTEVIDIDQYETLKQQYISQKKDNAAKPLSKQQQEELQLQYVQRKAEKKEQQNIQDYEKMKAEYIKKKGIEKKSMNEDQFKELKQAYLKSKGNKKDEENTFDIDQYEDLRSKYMQKKGLIVQEKQTESQFEDAKAAYVNKKKAKQIEKKEERKEEITIKSQRSNVTLAEELAPYDGDKDPIIDNQIQDRPCILSQRSSDNEQFVEDIPLFETEPENTLQADQSKKVLNIAQGYEVKVGIEKKATTPSFKKTESHKKADKSFESSQIGAQDYVKELVENVGRQSRVSMDKKKKDDLVLEQQATVKKSVDDKVGIQQKVAFDIDASMQSLKKEIKDESVKSEATDEQHEDTCSTCSAQVRTLHVLKEDLFDQKLRFKKSEYHTQVFTKDNNNRRATTNRRPPLVTKQTLTKEKMEKKQSNKGDCSQSISYRQNKKLFSPNESSIRSYKGGRMQSEAGPNTNNMKKSGGAASKVLASLASLASIGGPSSKKKVGRATMAKNISSHGTDMQSDIPPSSVVQTTPNTSRVESQKQLNKSLRSPLQQKMSQYSRSSRSPGGKIHSNANQSLASLNNSYAQIQKKEPQGLKSRIEEALTHQWEDWLIEKNQRQWQFIQAIQRSDSSLVLQLLKDEEMKAKNMQVEVNQTFQHNGMVLSPLLWAIQCYDSQDSSILTAILDQGADVTYVDPNSGFNCLIMCCHLKNEQDALYIATILCEHNAQLSEQQKMDVNVQDKKQNTALHHATMARKLNLAKYLVDNFKVDFSLKNTDGLFAIDLAQSKDFKLLLQKYQKPQDLKKLGKQKLKSPRVKSQATAKVAKGSTLEFKNKYTLWQKEKSEKMKGAMSAGGMTMRVGNANDTAPSELMQIQDFKILNRVGNSKSNIFLACCKKHGKNLSKEQLFAIKIVEKSRTSNHVRYDLETKQSINSIVQHPCLANFEFVFMNEDKLFICTEYCQGGNLSNVIKSYNSKKQRMSEDDARKYASEIVAALGHLHTQNIVHKQLTADSILIQQNGHIKVKFYGLGIERKDDGLETIGNYVYTAPETLDLIPETNSTDWYLLGLLLYEMIVGKPPFLAPTRSELYENIQTAELQFPDFVSDNAVDLISRLLEYDPQIRLGGLMGMEEITGHPFFQGVKWSLVDLQKQKMPPVLAVDSKFLFNASEKKVFESYLDDKASQKSANTSMKKAPTSKQMMNQGIPKGEKLDNPEAWQFDAQCLQSNGFLTSMKDLKQYIQQ